MGFSWNGDKMDGIWMVYQGKTQGWFGGTSILGNFHIWTVLLPFYLELKLPEQIETPNPVARVLWPQKALTLQGHKCQKNGWHKWKIPLFAVGAWVQPKNCREISEVPDFCSTRSSHSITMHKICIHIYIDIYEYPANHCNTNFVLLRLGLSEIAQNLHNR